MCDYEKRFDRIDAFHAELRGVLWQNKNSWVERLCRLETFKNIAIWLSGVGVVAIVGWFLRSK